jgi:hypothetical protein
MTVFKKEILTRFVGTNEGEVTEYLGCELIRDHSAKTAKIVQKGNTECVLKTVNSRLSKTDCPEVVDPVLHHRYHSITGCLSYLVNMTRPDLAFAYSQLSKFV